MSPQVLLEQSRAAPAESRAVDLRGHADDTRRSIRRARVALLEAEDVLAPRRRNPHPRRAGPGSWPCANRDASLTLMSRPLMEWGRSTLGWRPDGTVLYVEHNLFDRPMVTFVPALEEWLEEQDWGVRVVRHSGARRQTDENGSRYTFGMVELQGENLMQRVDPVAIRDAMNRLAEQAELHAQQQIDQDEKGREDFLAALRAKA